MRRLIVAGGVAMLLAVPAGAYALGTATLSGDNSTDQGVWDYGAIHMVAAGDTADDITFTEDPGGITAHDPGVLITGVVNDEWVPFFPGPVVCSDESGTRTCAYAPMLCTTGVGSATCSQKSLDTAAQPQLVTLTADGGAGNDHIVIPDIQSSIGWAYGGSGDDTLDASYVFGGPGGDMLHGVAMYGDQTAGISASDDGIANDGLPGEGDDILPGSGVEGTPFADRITLSGNGDAYGEGGDDVIDVRNGVRNVVSCGSGDDTVTADALDQPSGDCEHVTVG